MTDEDFLDLIADELKICITKEKIPTYKKAILNCAKVLKDENKKSRELIKEIVVKNFSCSSCKELGLFDDCNAKKKSCEQTVSEWFDEVMEQENDNR